LLRRETSARAEARSALQCGTSARAEARGSPARGSLAALAGTGGPGRATLTAALAALAALMAAGCGGRSSRFEVVDYRAAGQVSAYHEAFEEAYYRVTAGGDVDVVLRRVHDPAVAGGPPLTQVIHVHSIWTSIPGTTVAESAQINGTVSYFITDGGSGAAFEGAGSVFFRRSRDGTELTGEVERVFLTPQRRLNGGQALFTRAELSGAFVAKRDPQRVVRILNETQRLFGPVPRYQPPMAGG